MPNNENNNLKLMGMVSHIVAAYVSNHKVEPSNLHDFMQQVQRSLCKQLPRNSFLLSSNDTPAVPVEQSITPDYIICLEDGKQMKMLKRYLKTSYGITPEVYRERWGLPVNYPMVAPNYAKRRQSIAKSIGLGRKQKKVA